MFDSYLSGINDDHVENRLTKRMNNLQQAIDAFRDEYDRVLKDNLEMLNLDKIVRRKCDGATGVLRIKRCDDGSAVPSCYAFYRFKKDGLLAAKHSATCGSLVNEITLFYEPVTDWRKDNIQMAQKLVLEMSIYTDGDWSYQKDIIRNYTSKYFDNYLYEYTEFIFDYESRFRRVFDFNGDFKPVENLIRQICDSIKGRDTEYIKEFFDRVIEVLPQTTIDRPLIDEMDSNTEINIIVKIIETDAKEIDRIIYKN